MQAETEWKLRKISAVLLLFSLDGFGEKMVKRKGRGGGKRRITNTGRIISKARVLIQ